MSNFVTIGQDIETGQPVTIGDTERRSALYILGKPGMGKSFFMVQVMNQDMRNKHGVFFLDPHGDAIDELLKLGNYYTLSVFAKLLNPEDETHSFGINLLSCRDIHSLKARTDTYTRAYNVFYKLWEDSWGPWLQLILQNTLWAFIENQEYTLAEVPMFLNPRNVAFRNYILSNIKHNSAVVEFWLFEFFARREREQQERVDAALTRITTLLTHPYVRHIIGQRKTTIDFEDILANRQIILFSLSANLAPDIKRFIGTILISELLHAIRNRQEGKREQFCIFVDEFQNFAQSEDFTTLITEARKFGIATTICHVERFGQFAKNQKLLGATLAAVNKVFFQLTVKDAQELASEFAQKPEETQAWREAALVISPRAVEDIWERGHPNQMIMDMRHRYFRVVDLLKTKPNENYYVFDPDRAQSVKGNRGKLDWWEFDDWEMYRSSPDMIREGISLLDKYYYDVMQHKPFTANNYKNKPVSNKELELILKVIECFGGVLGFRPTMQPYIPDEMRHVYLNRIIQKKDRDLKDFIQHWEHGGGKEAASRTMYPGPWAMNDPGQMRFRLEKDFPELLEEWKLTDIPSVLNTSSDIRKWRDRAIDVGFSQSELEQFIQWRVNPLIALEAEPLTEMVKIVANMDVDEATFQREQSRVNREYTAIMSHGPMVARLGIDHSRLPFEVAEPHLQKVVGRVIWQMTELQHFIIITFRFSPNALEREPIKVTSGKYDEKLKVERTQADLITEMGQELANLPRFTAYAKVIEERNGIQSVLKRKINTSLTPSFQGYPRYIKDKVIESGHQLCKERSQIEEDLRQRQERWRSSGSEEPPPTHS
jgi:hypothetical protein